MSKVYVFSRLCEFLSVYEVQQKEAAYELCRAFFSDLYLTLTLTACDVYGVNYGRIKWLSPFWGASASNDHIRTVRNTDIFRYSRIIVECLLRKIIFEIYSLDLHELKRFLLKMGRSLEWFTTTKKIVHEVLQSKLYQYKR